METVSKHDLKLIALLFPPTVGYFDDVVTGIQRFAQTQDWILESCPTFDAALAVARSKRRPDGVLFHSGEWDWKQLLGHVRDIPLVQVGGMEIPDLPRVTTDNHAIGMMAAEHFLERGFTRFAFCGYEHEDWSCERETGFERVLKKAGFRCFDKLTATFKVNGATVTREMADWVRGLTPGPVAVFACHDRAARLVAHACSFAGLSVPDDIAILGVDNNLHECAMLAPHLSSVMGSARRVGYDAAAILRDLMEGRPAPREALMVPPAGVVVRQSTDILALQDADVATAVRFIRERAAESIDVEDVVEATIISRRLLEKKFAAILKRSPRQEILLSHLHQAKTLLLSTSLGAADIAVRSGFPSASKFSAVFRRETGMTPSEFRRLYGVHV